MVSGQGRIGGGRSVRQCSVWCEQVCKTMQCGVRKVCSGLLRGPRVEAWLEGGVSAEVLSGEHAVSKSGGEYCPGAGSRRCPYILAGGQGREMTHSSWFL